MFYYFFPLHDLFLQIQAFGFIPCQLFLYLGGNKMKSVLTKFVYKEISLKDIIFKEIYLNTNTNLTE